MPSSSQTTLCSCAARNCSSGWHGTMRSADCLPLICTCAAALSTVAPALVLAAILRSPLFDRITCAPFRNQPYSSVDIYGHIYGHGDYATNLGVVKPTTCKRMGFSRSSTRSENLLRLFVTPFRGNTGDERWNSATHTRHLTVSAPQTSHLEELGIEPASDETNIQQCAYFRRRIKPHHNRLGKTAQPRTARPHEDIGTAQPAVQTNTATPHTKIPVPWLVVEQPHSDYAPRAPPMNDSPISHDSGTLLRGASTQIGSEPAPLPRLRGVSPLASAILLSATNTSKVTQFIASRYIPKPRSITGLKARNMPAPLNDTRPHLHAHTMPHATSPTAVSNHQATLCLLTFRSHRIRPSSMPTEPPASASSGMSMERTRAAGESAG